MELSLLIPLSRGHPSTRGHTRAWEGPTSGAECRFRPGLGSAPGEDGREDPTSSFLWSWRTWSPRTCSAQRWPAGPPGLSHQGAAESFPEPRPGLRTGPSRGAEEANFDLSLPSVWLGLKAGEAALPLETRRWDGTHRRSSADHPPRTARALESTPSLSCRGLSASTPRGHWPPGTPSLSAASRPGGPEGRLGCPALGADLSSQTVGCVGGVYFWGCISGGVYLWVSVCCSQHEADSPCVGLE